MNGVYWLYYCPVSIQGRKVHALTKTYSRPTEKIGDCIDKIGEVCEVCETYVIKYGLVKSFLQIPLPNTTKLLIFVSSSGLYQGTVMPSVIKILQVPSQCSLATFYMA